MKRKWLALGLSAVMVSGLAACGGGAASSTAPAAESTKAESTAPAAESTAPAAESTKAESTAAVEGTTSTLNIYCWNEEFKTRLEDHYPGYEKIDATHGKIGDVAVNFNITPNTDNAYQNNLDETLLNMDSAAADSKIDMFLVEADYALKYVDTDYTMNVKDLGITDEDISKQYKYTQDIVTDSNGNLKGLSWQGCPGVLIYNREAAKEVFGSDDPATVQEYVKDWDTFAKTATVYSPTTSPASGYRTARSSLIRLL